MLYYIMLQNNNSLSTRQTNFYRAPLDPSILHTMDSIRQLCWLASTVAGVWVHGRRRRVQETSLRWLQLHAVVCYPSGGSLQIYSEVTCKIWCLFRNLIDLLESLWVNVQKKWIIYTLLSLFTQTGFIRTIFPVLFMSHVSDQKEGQWRTCEVGVKVSACLFSLLRTDW